jgi:Chaperone of endosialidase
MHQPIQLKTAIPSARNSISRSHLRRGFVLLALICFGLSPAAQTAPRPDGDVGNGNTAGGSGALFSLTTCLDNTANGYQALYKLTTASYNTATGFQTLLSNTTGYSNTATGFLGLQANTTGAANTANGNQTLYWNTVGNANTADGNTALFNNTTGNQNTAAGEGALYYNTTGFQNTAHGGEALYYNTGNFNTACGFEALYLTTTGSYNIALGYYSGANLTTGGYNIDIGNPGVAGESSTIRIGAAGNQSATFIAGISGTPVSGVAVVVDTNGQLGILASSERFKDEIKPMDKASEAVLGLKPVTFRYKEQVDPKQVPQFGLVAEEVEKVDPDLVARDKNGKVYTVRYEAVNAMLLNEFLKEHRRVEELETAVKQLQSTVAEQQKSSRKKAH